MLNVILVIFFIVVCIVALLEEYLTDNHKKIVLMLLITSMVFVCATKEIGVDPDSPTYEDIFLNNDDPLYEISTEPTYIYLSRLLISLGCGVSVLFLIYALIAVPSKLGVMTKLTPLPFLALVVYIPVYYELHDLIQIRAAAASALLLVSIPFLHDKRMKMAAVLMFSAVTIHYSTIMALPLLFVGNIKLNNIWRILLASIVPVGFILYMLHIDVLSLIPSSLIGGKLDFYKNSAESGMFDEMITPYKNVYFMIKCAVYMLMLYYYDDLKHDAPYITIIIKYVAVSIFAMFAFSNIPTLATRTSDLFGVVDPILFTYLIYLTRQQWIAKAVVMMIGLYMLVFNIVVSDYFS